MAADYSICLGTAGWGVWHSPDAGRSWTRHRAPFPLNSRIQALVAHPTEAHTVFAGGDTGLFVSHDGGARWERIGADGALPTIWSLAVDPVDPDILFAGTRPSGVYRSRDGGRHWEKLAIGAARECSIGEAFVTSLVVDPDDHRMVWAGVEIDGVFRSRDGGDTWTHLDGGFVRPGHSRRDDRGDAAQAPLCQHGARSVCQQRSGRDLAALGHQGEMAAALCPRHGGQGR